MPRSSTCWRSAFASPRRWANTRPRHGLAASDPGREDRQIARLRALAEDADLDPEFSEKFIRFVIDEVIRHHQKAANGG